MEIYNERLDDIGLIIEVCERMSIKKAVENSVKTHGNQMGMSSGEKLVVWASYILSEGDHRKSHVSQWVESHKKILEAYFEKEIKASDFEDDKLSNILEQLSLDDIWYDIERYIWSGTVEILELKESERRKIWLDATTISGHHKINEEGLLQYGGHSKDHRPDLPQLKLMLSVDNNTSMPIATDIVAGNKNDDILYLPSIKRTREILGKEIQKGTLYSGDCKMSSLAIRADIAKEEEYYICPLQVTTKARKKLLSQAIEKAIAEQVVTKQIDRERAGKNENIGEGYEYERMQKHTQNSKTIRWKERLQVINSNAYRKAQQEKLTKTLNKAIEQIKNLKGKQFKVDQQNQSEEYIQKKVDKIIVKNSLEGLLNVTYKTEDIKKEYERTEKRKGKQRTGKYTITKIKTLPATVELNKERWINICQRLGWRLYVTNVPKEKLSLQESYNHYRCSQHIIENSFHVMKDKPIGVRPIFVWKEEQIKGLMRLLTLCLKISTIINTKLKLSLSKHNETLDEIYAGQPKKKTSSPTTKTILNLFYRQNIILTRVIINNQVHWAVSEMSKTCKKILNYLGLFSYQTIVATLQKQETKEIRY